MSAPTPHAHRPEIQALRALAVVLVVVYHLRPHRLTGGYVGVDVFFVISGFLITSHLFRELAQTGSIRLSHFYARRVRRLLPAGFTVLLVTAGFTALWLPKALWEQTFTEIGASALYGLNWLLATNSVDYLAVDNVPSLVQHYWSLSVEEQFYIVWPGLLLATLFVARRILGRIVKPVAGADLRRILVPVMVVVLGLSAAASVIVTAHTRSYAYFITPTRVWEFAAGGLLALLLTENSRLLTEKSRLLTENSRLLTEKSRRDVALPAVASWTGLGLILASAWFLNDESAFPGWLAAAPVLGTVLVIWAGHVDHPWSPTSLMTFGPVQLVGDISYGVYLWHWPLILAYPYVRGVEPGVRGALVIIAATLLLAWLTQRLIEDPVRTGRFWLAKRRRSYALAAAGSVAVVLISASGVAVIHDLQEQARRPQLSFASTAEIAAEIERSRTMTQGEVYTQQEEQPGGRGLAAPEWIHDRCLLVNANNVTSCRYGPTTASHLAVVVGDSVAISYLPTLRAALEPRGWQIQMLTWEICPVADVRMLYLDGNEHRSCQEHRPWKYEELAALKPDMIIGSNDLHAAVAGQVGKGGAETWVPAAEAAFAHLASISRQVVILGAPPRLNCAETPGGPCKPGWDVEFHALEQRTAQRSGVIYINTMSWFCRDNYCPEFIGSTRVRADDIHLTERYARRLDLVFLDALSSQVDYESRPTD